MITGLHTTFKDDYALGKKCEMLMLPKLKTFFKDDTINQLDEFNKNDFISSDGTKYEMKSRRINHNQFKTTLMPVNKVLTDSTQTYFIFRFMDKDCYIKFEPNMFSKYRTEILIDGRAGKNNYKKLHYHIPIEDLIDF